MGHFRQPYPPMILAPLDNELAQRMLTSEVGGESAAIKRAVLWAVRNRATDMQTSLYESGTLGYGFGPVGIRPYDTHQVPDTGLRRQQQPLIDAVFGAPAASDPTGGANDWFQPGEEDWFHAQGLPGYTRTAAQVIADMESHGAVPRGIVGSGRGRVMLFSKRLGRYRPRASGIGGLAVVLALAYAAWRKVRR